MGYFDYVALPAFAGEGGVGTSVEITKKTRGRAMDRALAAVRLSRAEEALERAVGDLADGRAAEERLSEEDKQGSADDVKKRALLAEVTRLATVAKILTDTCRDTYRDILRGGIGTLRNILTALTPVLRGTFRGTFRDALTALTPVLREDTLAVLTVLIPVLTALKPATTGTALSAGVQPKGDADVLPLGKDTLAILAALKPATVVGPEPGAGSKPGTGSPEHVGEAEDRRQDPTPQGAGGGDAETSATLKPATTGTALSAGVQPKGDADVLLEVLKPEGVADVALDLITDRLTGGLLTISVCARNALAAMGELDKAKRAALVGGVTQGDVDAACIVKGDDLPGDPSKVDAYLSGLEKRADDLKKFAKLKSGETEAAVERAINELAAAKGETDWFGFSRSTWAGAATGVFVGIFLACGVLFTPAALAAVGLAGASALALVGAGLATAVVAAVLGGVIGAGMNWVHGWVERESAKAAVTGVGAGMLLWAAGIIAGSVCPSSIATACLAAVGCAATPVILGVAAGVALVPTVLAGGVLGAAFGAAWSYFRSGSSISAKDGAAPDTPDTPESAELSPS